MTEELHFDIQAQPDDTTCGPTCLQAVYNYFDDEVPLPQVISEVPALSAGGTLAVLLGEHALRRGYDATIYTYNLEVFDPSWFHLDAGSVAVPSSKSRTSIEEKLVGSQEAKSSVKGADLHRQFLIERLREQSKHKPWMKLQVASAAYMQFLTLGGTIHMQELNSQLIRRFLKKSIPILTGLSSTYLYFTRREIPENCKPDDVRGCPCGHFVILCGYNQETRTVSVADPYLHNPLGEKHHYEVPLDRLIAAILLGVLTYDANLLLIEPQKHGSRSQPHITPKVVPLS